MTTTSLGHIYKIICKVDEKFCYIGSTFNRLSKRMEEHRNQYNKWMKGGTTPCSCFSYFQKYGIENFKIVLIKSYEVCRTHNKDSWHLRAYETLWFNKTKCVNKNSPIDYLKKEKRREYKVKNRAKTREYYEKNREEFCAKQREYREKNREEICAKQREKVKCEFCGSMIAKSGLAEHKRSKKCLKAQGK
jgi:hypothetical protein